MVQSQCKSARQQWGFYGARRGDLLQRHPVLAPVLLLGCALFLSTTGIFTDTFFSATSHYWYLFRAIMLIVGSRIMDFWYTGHYHRYH